MTKKDSTPVKEPRPLFKPKKEQAKSADKNSHARSKSRISKLIHKTETKESSGI